MDTSWIKLYRKLLESPLWLNSTPEHKTIMITLLLMVNHKQKKWEWNGIEFNVKQGQVVTSLESIKQKCGKGISIQNIRSCLKRLEKLQFVTNKSTKSGRLISIINWDSYQPSEKKPTKIVTKEQQRSNKGVTPNNNVKNVRMKEKQIDEPKKPGSPSVVCPQIKIRKLYNSILPELPEVKSTNRTVEAMVRKRWREDHKRQSLDWWQNYFTGIRDMDFLMGKVNGKHFNATFEWLVRPTNMSKVLNGNYKNKENTPWINF